MVWILPQAQAEVGHLWSGAGATCVGEAVNLPNPSGPDSARSESYSHGWCLLKLSENFSAKNKQDCKISGTHPGRNLVNVDDSHIDLHLLNTDVRS